MKTSSHITKVEHSLPGWSEWNGIELPFEIANELSEQLLEKRRQERAAAILEFEANAKIEPKSKTEDSTEDDFVWSEPFFDADSSLLEVFKKDCVIKHEKVAQTKTPDRNTIKRTDALIKHLKERGSFRKLANCPVDWREQLTALQEQFPNFSAVIEHIAGMCAIAERCNCGFQMGPILLDGPPGVGKSLFAERFGQFIGSAYTRVNLETAQENSALCGSAEYWSNSKPGRVFDSLIDGDYANPVILLDEIDKARAGHHDPLAALLGLLEPGTARTFQDQSFPWLTLDASRVIWICTSNDANFLPAPLLSRIRCFDIPMPTEHQSRRIVLQIFSQLKADMPELPKDLRLTQAALNTLSCIAPREVRRNLRDAIGKALFEARNKILPSDLRSIKNIGHQRRIGF